MLLKYLCTLVGVFYGTTSFAYEINQEGDNITVRQEYYDQSSVEITLWCPAKSEGLVTRWGSEIELKLPKPVDMRVTDNEYYKVIIGGYESCDKNEFRFDDYICQNLSYDLNFGTEQLEFLNYTPKIDIIKVFFFDPEINANYQKSCPENTTEDYWNGCKSQEIIHSFDLKWLSAARDDMSKLCASHQDKITSHIKRILDW